MKITGATAHTYDLKYKFGDYGLSKGRVSSSNPSLVVQLYSDAGIVGFGEAATLGRAHVNGFYESDVEALKVLYAAVLGLDPREPLVLQATMDAAVKGALGAKSAVDIACWDMAGKSAGLPISVLLGGRLQLDVRAWDSIPLLAPSEIPGHFKANVLEGVSVIQIKVGTDPLEDCRRVEALVKAAGDSCIIVADANCGWNVQDALLAARSMKGANVFLEQPCASLSNCAIVRESSDIPMIIDEGCQSLEDIIEIKARVGAGGVSIKPAKLGGLTRARMARDMAVELGMMITVDDLWGGAIISAALAHLAASTPRGSLLAVTPFSDLAVPAVGAAPRCRRDGRVAASSLPGLGIEIDTTLISPPLFSIGQVG